MTFLNNISYMKYHFVFPMVSIGIIGQVIAFLQENWLAA